MALPDCSVYRPRQPRASPLYRPVDARYREVHEQWEERFDIRYGFWRSLTDRAVAAFLDCGILENGSARVRCGACAGEHLVAFSCHGGGLYPSCAAKRAAELLARVLIHIPEPWRHLVRYYGAYSSVVRARRRAQSRPRAHDGAEVPPPTSPERRALRRMWAALIRRIYEVDPLVCPRCGGAMRIIALITEPNVINKILRHLRSKAPATRGPPQNAGAAAA